MRNKKYKILLTGGGTGGSVTPLLAVAEELKTSPGETFEFLWLGTKFGPEREMVEKAGIKFKAISHGKWRRDFSLKNLVDIFKIKIGFWQAFFVLIRWRPDLVMSAGSFVGVPVVWAAWLLGVPVLIHQQDISPGLANKLMSPFAKVVTVTFEKSLIDYGQKAVWIGNPIRSKKLEVRSKNNNYFGLGENLPIVLIVGGGTGAEAINKLVADSLSKLTKFCQVIQVTGKGKGIRNQELEIRNYVAYEFLDAEQMAEAMNAADLVVSRAGMGFLSELSYLGKSSIIIPLPDSHQEANAAFFKSQKAAIVIEQKDLTALKLTQLIKDLLTDKKMLANLSVNMRQIMKPGANQALLKIINKIIK